MIPFTRAFPFTPLLIITDKQTNFRILNTKKLCEANSLNCSKAKLTNSSPVISQVFADKLFSLEHSLWPLNNQCSNPKLSTFKLNLINYSLPFDNREIIKVNTIKNNPNHEHILTNPTKQKLITAYNDKLPLLSLTITRQVTHLLFLFRRYCKSVYLMIRSIKSSTPTPKITPSS